MPSPTVAEALSTAAFDFVTVDTEHAPTTTESVENMVRAVDAAPGDTETVVRVAENDPVRIKRVLDAGPAGLMAPQVNSAAEAAALVEACRYPPQVDGDGESAGTGRRGVAASRASDYGRRLDEYVRHDSFSIAVIAQIETERAVAAAGEIAAVDGIDALFVGPADLSASMGRFRAFDDPAVREAIDATVAAGDEAGVPVGTLATSEARIDAWLEAGFDFLIVGTDVGFLSTGADRAIERYHDRH